ncbi:MAG: hypothetical protein ABH823_04635 [bacterium]
MNMGPSIFSGISQLHSRNGALHRAIQHRAPHSTTTPQQLVAQLRQTELLNDWHHIFYRLTQEAQQTPHLFEETELFFCCEDQRTLRLSLHLPKQLSDDQFQNVARYLATNIHNEAISLGVTKVLIRSLHKHLAEAVSVIFESEYGQYDKSPNSLGKISDGRMMSILYDSPPWLSKALPRALLQI